MTNDNFSIQIYGYLNSPINIKISPKIKEQNKLKIVNDILRNIALYFKEKLKLDLNNLYIYFYVF